MDKALEEIATEHYVRKSRFKAKRCYDAIDNDG